MRPKNLKSLLLMILVFALMSFPSAATAQQGQLITRRVLTPSYEFSADGIAVSEAALSDVPGLPQLPIKGFTVQLPATGDWTLAFASTDSQILLTQMDIPSVPVPDLNLNTAENWSSNLDSLPSTVSVVEQPDASVYGANAFYPALPVMAGEPQISEWAHGSCPSVSSPSSTIPSRDRYAIIRTLKLLFRFRRLTRPLAVVR